jgi:hypothetical protein
LTNASKRAPSMKGEPARPDEELAPGKPSTAVQRALAEAQERRLHAVPPLPPEVDGRGGLEPVRYGDWEVKGLASDF